jgi:hypothetical protein
MLPFELNSVYSFNTVAPAILGLEFKRVTVLAVLNYSIANTFINIETNHINIYPYLPTGTVNDPKTYQYLLIKAETGENTVLAIPWIDLDSVTQVTTQSLILTVNNINSTDTTKIRDAMIMLGYNSFTISVL